MMTLGERIKHQRKIKGYSLRTLANMVGVTASFISLVETNKSMPSIETLRNISEKIGIPVGELISLSTASDPVVRKGSRMKLQLAHNPIPREILTPGFDHRFQIFEVNMNPGEYSSEELYSHSSEEFSYVLEGIIEIEIGDKKYRLEAHDSITFEATIPHRTHCVGDCPARYIVVDVPPVV